MNKTQLRKIIREAIKEAHMQGPFGAQDWCHPQGWSSYGSWLAAFTNSNNITGPNASNFLTTKINQWTNTMNTGSNGGPVGPLWRNMLHCKIEVSNELLQNLPVSNI